VATEPLPDRRARGSAAAAVAWKDQVVRPRESEVADSAWPRLATPRLRVDSGSGQVTLRWDPVQGAAGYLVYRGSSPDRPFQVVDHGGGDLVRAVPGPSYADTTGRPGEPAWYAVAAVAAVDAPPGQMSRAAGGIPRASPTDDPVRVEVDASHVLGALPRPWRMVGSEHLSQLLYPKDDRGIDVGREFQDAFRLARRELGVTYVRAHAILHDELSVYRELDGQSAYDFSKIDAVYDALLGLGIRPVVELSFMPHDLARDPNQTVFHYQAIIAPPRDWERWRGLITAFAAHLVDRYGLDEVSSWAFEVWNEANLGGFWSGSLSDYLRLYDETAAAVKSVSPKLRVGGPSTASGAWIGDLAAHAVKTGVPVDFLSTHIYGMLPVDVGATARDLGLRGVPVWWTEWRVNPRHFSAVNDAVFGAPFILHGMLSAMGRDQYLAYWVLSDHFEELGPPPRLFHGGFGLLTVGNLRKPRYWALRMLEMLGPERLALELEGDGGGSLLNALATRDGNGGLCVLVWNGTLDQSKVAGDRLLDRQVELRLRNLRTARYGVEHYRVDEAHSHVRRTWEAIGSPDWPDQAGWATLRSKDRLEELDPPREVASEAGQLALRFELPNPGVSLLRFSRRTPV